MVTGEDAGTVGGAVEDEQNPQRDAHRQCGMGAKFLLPVGRSPKRRTLRTKHGMAMGVEGTTGSTNEILD
ncbi:hypothetical protein KCP73_15755 [Salmonella enterica subsp. enterica]|nr:hypothetical protein KCP73_15755 [Salmonella enterica subsp. enterica]